MFLKAKYLFMKIIIIELYLTTIINANLIIITDKNIIENLLKQIKTQEYSSKKDGRHFEKYKDGGSREFKQRLVKRFIPHGFKQPIYEYNGAYQSIYTPLFRVHKTKQLKSMMDLLRRLHIKSDVRKMFTKSGEVHDHLAPGAFTIINSHEEDKKKPPKKRLPEYPFWNYWTYNKDIYEDECPINTVKNDGVCIRVKPH